MKYSGNFRYLVPQQRNIVPLFVPLSYYPPYLIELLANKLTSHSMSRGILAARSISHFLGQKSVTFSARKINNFYRRILKLQNCAFQIANSNNAKKNFAS